MKEYLERGAGILLHISSIPSPYGIGTFGKEAYKVVDSIAAAKQKYWQVLPLGPTSYGDSPYASFSAFAGNPYFIDLDMLIEEGLLTKEYVESFKWNYEEDLVDFGTIYNSRFKVLKKAYEVSNHKEDKEYLEFITQNDFWLKNYALYMSCKKYFKDVSWQEWDEDIRRREPEAVLRYSEMLEEDINFWEFIQYKFYAQWKELKEYANEKGIQVIGDIPIYVALDSADVWANTDLFQMDENLNPKKVAGVPPDAFSATGQLWGNPLYDWAKMEEDDFGWWRKRMKAQSEFYDVIRIDHFIGIVTYYTIPAGDEDATKGKYEKGPGIKLIKAINESVGDKKIIAEDLGVIIPEVEKVLKESGYPGMKVMEFAFDGNRRNTHLPYYWTANTVAYGGTHDNDTLMGYYSALQPWELGYIREYLKMHNGRLEDIVDELIRVAYSSVANVVIFQMQDILKIGNKGRMNLPSSMGINWMWRMKKDEFGPNEIERLRYLCDIYGR